MEGGKLLLFSPVIHFLVLLCSIVPQVKTWFANARRRIHKGGDLIPAKHGGSSYVMKEQLDDDDLMSHNTASGACSNVSLPSDPVSSHNLSWLPASPGRNGQILKNI